MTLARPVPGRTARAYAELVRVPNLFTAPPDVVLGAALAVAAGARAALLPVLAAALGSALVYAAGTTLNDYFDAPVDAEERPGRPIPSGRVSRRLALLLGLGLLAAGVVAASLAGSRAGAVAAVLALVVLAYDGLLGGGPLGPPAMGTARGLNVLLGAAAVGPLAALPGWALAVPAIVALYIGAVTVMADREAAGADRWRVGTAAAGAALAGLAVPATLLVARPGTAALALGVGLAVGFVAWTGRALASAYRDPAPDVVGPAVGTCVLALVVLDAAFAAAAGLLPPLLALAFLAPAVGLSRAYDVS